MYGLRRSPILLSFQRKELNPSLGSIFCPGSRVCIDRTHVEKADKYMADDNKQLPGVFHKKRAIKGVSSFQFSHLCSIKNGWSQLSQIRRRTNEQQNDQDQARKIKYGAHRRFPLLCGTGCSSVLVATLKDQ